jgi:hypothetical protein
LLESYERALEKILKLQQLAEMEEIIEMKHLEKKVARVSNENKGEYTYKRMLVVLEEKKEKLKSTWHDRLLGVPRRVDVWYQILSTRQLYKPKQKDMATWIKFAKLALKL